MAVSFFWCNHCVSAGLSDWTADVSISDKKGQLILLIGEVLTVLRNSDLHVI